MNPDPLTLPETGSPEPSPETVRLTVRALEEAIHSLERPTKLRLFCTRCRPKAEAMFRLLTVKDDER